MDLEALICFNDCSENHICATLPNSPWQLLGADFPLFHIFSSSQLRVSDRIHLHEASDSSPYALMEVYVVLQPEA